MADPLERLAKRVENDAFFLASLLAAYRDSQGLNDSGLASALGCPLENLTMMLLCRAPRKDPKEFREDIELVAIRFGADPKRVMEAVNRGIVVLTLREATDQTNAGYLMAARDGDAGTPEEKS